MKRIILFATVLVACAILNAQPAGQGKLPCRMEELTSPQFVKAVEASGGVCVIPIGIIEKHATQLPLGTDLFEARASVIMAAEKEYAVVFPPYYTGQIFEARHQPGTMAYSTDLMWKMLEETCSELSRNGLKKIILFNGHGGSTYFLQYFCHRITSYNVCYTKLLRKP